MHNFFVINCPKAEYKSFCHWIQCKIQTDISYVFQKYAMENFYILWIILQLKNIFVYLFCKGFF